LRRDKMNVKLGAESDLGGLGTSAAHGTTAPALIALQTVVEYLSQDGCQTEIHV
jgi:hypothetical protein